MKSTDSSNPAEKTLIHKQLNHSSEGKKAQQNNALLANSSGILCPGWARSFLLCQGENPGLYLRDPALNLVPVTPQGLAGHSGVSGAQAAAPLILPLVSLEPH